MYQSEEINPQGAQEPQQQEKQQAVTPQALQDVVAESDSTIDLTLESMGKNNTATEIDLQAPAWDLSGEYQGFDGAKYQNDLAKLKVLTDELDTLGKSLAPALNATGMDAATFEQALPTAWKMKLNERTARVLASDLGVYASCELSVNSEDETAKKMISRLQEMDSKIQESVVPLTYFLATISKEQIERFFTQKEASEDRFAIEKLREACFQRMLSPEGERLLAGLAAYGPVPWGNQYNSVSAAIRVGVEIEGKTEKLALSQTMGPLGSQDRDLRRRTWEAVEAAWESQGEAAAAGVNALAGWRHKENSLRSTQRPKHFLEDALHAGRVSAETVDAMMSVAKKNLPTAHRALLLLAKAFGGTSYEPWDYYAPLPQHLSPAEARQITFPEGLETSRQAFGAFHPELAEFITLTSDRKWIEARSLPTKRGGAYSSGFTGSGNPLTFMTWTGIPDNVRTFVHEQGHSFHSWCMRTLPPEQRNYPMTLAETASNMGEMLLADYEASKAKNKAELLPALWSDLQAGGAYLVNIPVRFEFEKEFYRRRESEVVTMKELSMLMAEKHKEWYGDTMTVPSKMFWASKMHFHFAEISFYNFPYTFGYLFATGIHALAKEHGSSFYPAYCNLLKDTGRMTCEEIAKTHLSVDLTKPDFWQKSYDSFSKKVDLFEEALKTA